jgi:hypothetical protein
VAGGTISSDWIPIRWERGRLQLHAIVDDLHWGGKLNMGTAVIVDVGFTEDEMSTLHDWLHRLADKRGPSTDAEAQEMHDAIEAHASGLADSTDVQKRREAAAASAQADQFKDVSDADLMEKAADGDVAAQQERNRRKVMKETAPSTPAPQESSFHPESTFQG